MSTFNTAYTATATNGAATITLAAIPGKSNTVSGVAWSYSATPTASNPTLTITDNGSTVFVI
jgi:hypothetical protein